MTTTTLEDARHLIAEGDRLLARATERRRSAASGGSTTDLDLAAQYYAEAAHAYLAGAAEYQRSDGATRNLTASPDHEHGAPRLGGRLAVEADAAFRDATHAAPDQSRDAIVERSRAFAQGLRERLAHAVPTLFETHEGTASGRTLHTGRSRDV